MNSWMLFRYINHSALSNKLMCLTASFFEMTQMRHFEDDSLLKRSSRYLIFVLSLPYNVGVFIVRLICSVNTEN